MEFPVNLEIFLPEGEKWGARGNIFQPFFILSFAILFHVYDVSETKILIFSCIYWASSSHRCFISPICGRSTSGSITSIGSRSRTRCTTWHQCSRYPSRGGAMTWRVCHLGLMRLWLTNFLCDFKNTLLKFQHVFVDY